MISAYVKILKFSSMARDDHDGILHVWRIIK